MDENELREVLIPYADPANFNRSYEGDSAEIGLKTPENSSSEWVLYFFVWVGDGERSYFSASVRLKEPGAAIESLELRAVPEELEASENYAGIFEYLPVDGPVDLSTICNRVLDKWIDLWNKVGGLRQFLVDVGSKR
jgi:hypothetical protein